MLTQLARAPRRHDRQDDVEEEDSEGCKEAEFEGSACSDPDSFRRRNVLGSHVPTLPAEPLRRRSQISSDRLRRFGGKRPRHACCCSFAPVWWETYP